MSVKDKKELSYFEIVDLGEIKGGAESCPLDTVWCKVGDSCGKYDNLCIPGGPGGTGHDGCCTGSWDHRGDGTEAPLPPYICVMQG